MALVFAVLHLYILLLKYFIAAVHFLSLFSHKSGIDESTEESTTQFVLALCTFFFFKQGQYRRTNFLFAVLYKFVPGLILYI